MPNIRGIYYNHPDTGEPGLWIIKSNGQLFGATDAEMNAMVPTTGQPATRVERARATIETWLQDFFTVAHPSTEFGEDWTWMRDNPELYCYVQGNTYYAQESIVSIEVFGINPLRYQITVSEGASRTQTAYG